MSQFNWQNSFVGSRLTPPFYRAGHPGMRRPPTCKHVPAQWVTAGIATSQSSSEALPQAQEPWSPLHREGPRPSSNSGTLTSLLNLPLLTCWFMLESKVAAGARKGTGWRRASPSFKCLHCVCLMIPGPLSFLCLVDCLRKMVRGIPWRTEENWEQLILIFFCRTRYLWIWYQESSCYFTFQESVSLKQEIHQV